ncbi:MULTISPECIES: substrate-binding periplasmic protein [Pseudomonas]|uniref:Transporter substrate-binding domain-containing protein n=1 Tax=Pseudomonas quebecensis TaxID=2995174 RepID=A0ABY6QIY4_9PSED|nr:MULTISPECIES: transporter substrate-binding domain-containing protein [Pseudomonas]MCP1512237.1 ABC-type amino acid transport substrate-binding protein [Pseudomonas rhodesiae]MCX4064199.1 transporter substrate-binding domain-containing protein [Pseudomonas quebecensis]MDF9771073.1 ABC-type amino acid transport substrate-binding protein [Pseudomonas rhodesiae]UZW19934.1 transporter substrate-binding domain-containing protein [Pseudomonas quebecensis]UZW22649.1 transporter substrate-binding d
MRVVLGALWMITTASLAAPAPLRFSVSDSWAMPMVQLENGQPTQGIMYDVMASLANQLGQPARFQVLARARIATAMLHGDIDVRCYVTQAWLDDLPGDYAWSVPLMMQRSVLVSTSEQPVTLAELAPQAIGTVLNYRYTGLAALFASGRLTRDEARSEEQVLHKLLAGRFQYAVINEWTVDRFNQTLTPEHRLHKVAVVDELSLGCIVRNDPKLPVQQILRTLLRMKVSGEIDEIIQLYTGQVPTQAHAPDKN